MSNLHELTSLVNKRKRVGRGGKRGGTSGKGNKGQKARSGPKIKAGFEGGQMPLYRRLPKRGFNNTIFRIPTCAVNVGRLNEIFEPNDVITKDLLLEKAIVKAPKGCNRFILKILSHGDLTKKLTVHADAFSQAARDSIERVGGQVHLIRKTE